MVLALSQINEVRINDCVILDELVDETAVGAYSAWSRGYGGGIGDGDVDKASEFMHWGKKSPLGNHTPPNEQFTPPLSNRNFKINLSPP